MRGIPAAMVLAATLAVGTETGYAPNLRFDATLSDFILRLSSRYGILAPASLFSQPMNAADAAAFFACADSLDKAGTLSAPESYTLDVMRRYAASENALFSWSNAEREIETRIRLQLTGRIDPAYGDSASIGLKGIINPSLMGNIGPLSYFTDIDVWTEYRSDTTWRKSTYQPSQGTPHNLYGRVDSGRVRASDILRGGISYRGKWFDLETGVDRLRQGPTLLYPLTLSGTAPPMIYARGRTDLGVFSYVQSVAQLNVQKDRAKYLYTHRIGAPIRPWRTNLGISEVIVNGSTAELAQTDSLRADGYSQKRGVEWAYLIPFIPYKFTEHFMGDRDNAFISLDANINYPLSFRWYGEFLIDDMTAPWTMFSSDWGNKWAFTVGGEWFGSLVGHDVSAIAEYSRVEPWVYTHFYGASHNYQHFNACIGSPLGPDADALTLNASSQITSRIAAGIDFTTIRQDPSARGGNITDVFQFKDSVYLHNGALYPSSTPDNWHKKFLGPGTVRTSTISLYGRYAPYELFSVNARVGVERAGENTSLRASVWGGFLF